ncbi:MAG: efflux transporter outer membrane subunit [Alphaproteobacteria bacterium]|nr:efflux transporter outer membrane subunit [Alphaproteobacteria bacterium]MBM3952190.1 efflux transporter outer membrane subunit [Rhodospirillales bacterium]
MGGARHTLLLLPLLGACSLTPDFQLPEIGLPAWWGNAEARTEEPETLGRPSAWWKSFGLPELDRAVETALANNHDLKAAVARIRQAEAQLAIAGAPLLPTVGASAQEQVLRRSTSSTTTSATSTSSSRGRRAVHSYEGSLSASYEVDFWGKTRATVAAAEETLRASEFDRDTVAHTLVAGVANAWFQAVALAERVETAKRNLAIARETLDYAEKQEIFGKTSALEAAQQRSNVALIESQVPALELQRRQALDGLAILIGLAPSALDAPRVTLDDISIPRVVPGLPSTLLLRRPDIGRAEANLRAANANIGVARAQIFPSVTLTAERGYSSAHLSQLLEPTSIFWNVGGALAVTIFDNDKLRGNVRLTEAKKLELTEAYRGSILAALRDVEDGLAGVRLLAEQEASQAVAVLAAREARRLADVRYKEGAVDYLAVLEAQRTLLQAEDGAVQVRLARLNAVVGLYKALGGGIGP